MQLYSSEPNRSRSSYSAQLLRVVDVVYDRLRPIGNLFSPEGEREIPIFHETSSNLLTEPSTTLSVRLSEERPEAFNRPDGQRDDN